MMQLKGMILLVGEVAGGHLLLLPFQLALALFLVAFS